eukprot:4245539-Prymnesium_polylepis.1
MHTVSRCERRTHTFTVKETTFFWWRVETRRATQAAALATTGRHHGRRRFRRSVGALGHRPQALRAQDVRGHGREPGPALAIRGDVDPELAAPAGQGRQSCAIGRSNHAQKKCDVVYLHHSATARRFFNQLDKNRDEKLSLDEVEGYFISIMKEQTAPLEANIAASMAKDEL